MRCIWRCHGSHFSQRVDDHRSKVRLNIVHLDMIGEKYAPCDCMNPLVILQMTDIKNEILKSVKCYAGG